MRIPPYYQNPSWQRFLAGVFIGVVIGWFLFLFMYGENQEYHIKTIIRQQSEIEDLKNDIDIWRKDYNDLNEQNEKKLRIQDIIVQFTNEKQIKRELKLDSLVLLSLRDSAKSELQDIIKKDIESVAENKKLLIKSIENKVFTIDNRSYQLEVEQLILYKNLELQMKIVYVK